MAIQYPFHPQVSRTGGKTLTFVEAVLSWTRRREYNTIHYNNTLSILKKENQPAIYFKTLTSNRLKQVLRNKK